jgi:CubicO group peptidase (beta-lactamase class C family)
VLCDPFSPKPHREGYGFGLGVAERTQAGFSTVPGRVGEFNWNGAYETIFSADPAERLVVVAGTIALGEIHKHYREQLQVLVCGAMTG